MQEKHVVKISKEVVRKIQCNKCEKVICEDFMNEPCVEGVTVNFESYYGSFCDPDYIKFDLCNECAQDFIELLKIEPEVY